MSTYYPLIFLLKLEMKKDW